MAQLHVVTFTQKFFGHVTSLTVQFTRDMSWIGVCPDVLWHTFDKDDEMVLRQMLWIILSLPAATRSAIINHIKTQEEEYVHTVMQQIPRTSTWSRDYLYAALDRVVLHADYIRANGQETYRITQERNHRYTSPEYKGFQYP